MRSLAVKLTLAFLFVGLIGAVFVALIVRQRTQAEFDRFIRDRNGTALAERLADYYQESGSWEGVGRVMRPDDPGAMGPGMGIFSQGLTFILIGPDGNVLIGGHADNFGKPISTGDLKNATPITVDGDIIGWVLPRTLPNPREIVTPESIFLANVNRAVFLSALAAVAVALVVGGFLAYTLTRSLRELTIGTQKVAAGDLGYQVDVRSRDELGVLANSFNQMSSDLAHANRLRRQMTADIAHDLRSPLSVILGYAEALNDGKLEGTAEVYDVMYQEAGHLSHLIDDLRTLSLADAGELPFNKVGVVPGELLEEIGRAYQQQADLKSITLKVIVPEDTPRIIVDPNRMVQVLGNLMSNALRYTPESGEIILGATTKGDAVVLYVQDNGVGIAAEDLPHLFDRFFRSDQSREQNGETGLGLAIAKSLVEAQGGRISVSSTPGENTTFYLNFQAAYNGNS
jgi:signal transduction histidine kinase